MIALALYQPDIPQNAGTLIRLAACFGIDLHVIHPSGFAMTDRRLRRAGLDYLARAAVTEHADWCAFAAWRNGTGRRLVAMTARGEAKLHDFQFRGDDLILLGRESAGLPEAVLAAAEARLRIAIRRQERSLNVAVAGAIAVAEALRQTRQFPA